MAIVERAKFFWILCWIMAAGAVAVYFRTYTLHGFPLIPSRGTMRVASNIVHEQIKSEMRKKLESLAPTLPEMMKERISEEQTQRAIEQGGDQYARVVQSTAHGLRKRLRAASSRAYLLGADSYYYYYLTSLISETGGVGARNKYGRYFNQLRNAPHGAWSYIYLHPYLGYYWDQLLRWMNLKMDLMESLSFFPLLLVVVSVVGIFVACSAFRVRWFAAFVASLVFVLAPIFIQRSSYGWYDTDPYNVIFPTLIFGVFCWGIQKPQHARMLNVLGGLLTGLYGLFWGGWPLIFSLILMCSFVVNAFRWMQGRGSKRISYNFTHTVIYALTTIMAALILLGPVRLAESFAIGFMFFEKFSSTQSELWPNIFMTVGETKSTSLKQIVYLTGTPVTAILAIVGAGASLGFFLKRKDSALIFQWVSLALAGSVFLIIALRTERFSLLLILPLSVLVALAVERVFAASDHIVFQRVNRQWAIQVSRGSLAAILLLIIVPLSAVSAHISGTRAVPIMNDVWYDALMYLKNKTPEDSIVNSWWAPGHFITSLGRRKVVIDGGDQYDPKSYWVSRAFMSANEKESVGFLRMLNLSGNKAVDYLLELGFDLDRAVDLLSAVVLIDEAEARSRLSQQIDANHIDALLKLTHDAERILPAYVLIYDDMVTQNLALTLVSGWDFAKAKEVNVKRAQARNWFNRFKFQSKDEYIEEAVELGGGILKYTPASKLENRAGSLLRFKNGLIADLNSMSAYVTIPDKNIEGQPVSFFYVSGGKLVEKMSPKPAVEVSALLYEEDSEYRSLLADRRLIRSMLFRLYYLKGAGLECFEPKFRRSDPVSETTVCIYQVQCMSDDGAEESVNETF